MTTLSATDSVFLWLETRNQPMHVAGLNIYSPPEGAGPDFVAKLLAQWSAYLQAVPPFNQRPALRMGLWHWEEDKEFELDYTDESIDELELALAAPPLVAARARRGAPTVRTPRRKASP